MSGAFHRLLKNPDTYAALVRAQDREGRMRVVAHARRYSIDQLDEAVRRVPTVPPRIAELYVAQGKPVPTWNLDDNDQAVEFCLALKQHKPTVAELDMALLLRTCVLAEEVGDVLPVAHARSGERIAISYAENASKDRKVTAAQKRRIKSFYADRVRNGEKYGAIKALMAELDLSRPTINAVISRKKK